MSQRRTLGRSTGDHYGDPPGDPLRSPSPGPKAPGNLTSPRGRQALPGGSSFLGSEKTQGIRWGLHQQGTGQVVWRLGGQKDGWEPQFSLRARHVLPLVVPKETCGHPVVQRPEVTRPRSGSEGIPLTQAPSDTGNSLTVHPVVFQSSLGYFQQRGTHHLQTPPGLPGLLPPLWRTAHLLWFPGSQVAPLPAL